MCVHVRMQTGRETNKGEAHLEYNCNFLLSVITGYIKNFDPLPALSAINTQQ